MIAPAAAFTLCKYTLDRVNTSPSFAVQAAKKEQNVAVCVLRVLPAAGAAPGSAKPAKGKDGADDGSRYLLVQRPEGGLLAGLWEFPGTHFLYFWLIVFLAFLVLAALRFAGFCVAGGRPAGRPLGVPRSAGVRINNSYFELLWRFFCGPSFPWLGFALLGAAPAASLCQFPAAPGFAFSFICCGVSSMGRWKTADASFYRNRCPQASFSSSRSFPMPSARRS